MKIVATAGTKMQNATFSEITSPIQKMDHTILKLARFCSIFMYNMFASEHKCKRSNRRGLIAKCHHFRQKLAQLRSKTAPLPSLEKATPTTYKVYAIWCRNTQTVNKTSLSPFENDLKPI